MKILIQKIHIEEHHSFACNTYRTPEFETAWHKHPECELILITEGSGTALIGDYVGDYQKGDVFFLSPELPHWFRKSTQDNMGSALVIHFQKDFLGAAFLALPELQYVHKFLERSNTGLFLLEDLATEMSSWMVKIDQSSGIERLQLLLTCLQKLSISTRHQILTMGFGTRAGAENSIIEQIIDYSFKNYLNPITLNEISGITSMSVPSFCRFFKKNIKKSYFDYIKELRIAHACKLLRDTDKAILDICYGSGYNSWAHFSKQFKNVTRLSPSHYRKQHFKV